MNAKEIKAARTLVEVVRQGQPRFLVSGDTVTIQQPDGESVELAIAQRKIITEESITVR